ncbi:MAG: sensor histidine kinase, partial [Candidatus Odinarchaeota archaeon]
MKEKDIPYLFDRFFRSDDVQEISGTGLGLSIAREFVKLHQGEIFAESEYGKGSIFSIFLPMIEENPEDYT